MEKTTVILFIVLLLILSGFLLTYNWVSYPDFKDYETKITQKYPNEELAYPEDYLIRCEFELLNGTRFPKSRPSYAILHFDSYFKESVRLTNGQMNEILCLLKDSNTYTWGELGTPYFDRFITFYDLDDNCIGLTKVDFGGQTYSTPHIAKMKWGLIRSEINTMTEIINKIENNR